MHIVRLMLQEDEFSINIRNKKENICCGINANCSINYMLNFCVRDYRANIQLVIGSRGTIGNDWDE